MNPTLNQSDPVHNFKPVRFNIILPPTLASTVSVFPSHLLSSTLCTFLLDLITKEKYMVKDTNSGSPHYVNFSSFLVLTAQQRFWSLYTS